MITYWGLESAARGGHFGPFASSWWENDKISSSLFQLSGHQVFHIGALTGPPRASDISEARSQVTVVPPVAGPASTGGHPTWTSPTFTNTPNALLRQNPVELLGSGIRLNLLGDIDAPSGSNQLGSADVTSLSTAPAAVSMVTSISCLLHFEGNTDSTSLFHGWFNANQFADDPGTTPGPAGFDMYNRSAINPDIAFGTCIYSPGLEMIRYDDLNVGNYTVNLFTLTGGGALVNTVTIRPHVP